jgi:ABC-type multidrug transport system fused ATPase/permease subunit
MDSDDEPTLGAAVATLGVSTAISLLFPFAIGQVLDVAIHPEGARAPGVIAAGLLGLFLVQSATIVVRGALLNVSGERMAAQMRKDLFKHILAQDMAWFDRHRTGDVITRLSNDTGVIQKALTSNVASGLRSAFMVAGGTGMLFYLSPYLALLSLSLIPPVAIAGMAYGTYVQGQQRAVQEAVGRTMEVAEELVGSVRTVRQFAREAPEAARFAARVEESFQLARRIGLVSALFDGAVHAAANASLVAVLWYGGDLVMAGSMSAGDLTAFLMYSLYTGVNIASLSGVYTELKRAAGAAQRVFAVADSLPSIPLAADANYWAAADNAVSRPGGVLASLSAAAPRALDTPPPALRATGPGARAAADAAVGHAALRALPGLRGDVTFDRIDFRYPTRGESPVLRGLDLVDESLKVGVVGGHRRRGRACNALVDGDRVVGAAGRGFRTAAGRGRAAAPASHASFRTRHSGAASGSPCRG